MIEAAQILTALAATLAAVSLHPRLRLVMKAAWACIAVVALCLGLDAFG